MRALLNGNEGIADTATMHILAGSDTTGTVLLITDDGQPFTEAAGEVWLDFYPQNKRVGVPTKSVAVIENTPVTGHYLLSLFAADNDLPVGGYFVWTRFTAEGDVLISKTPTKVRVS